MGSSHLIDSDHLFVVEDMEDDLLMKLSFWLKAELDHPAFSFEIDKPESFRAISA